MQRKLASLGLYKKNTSNKNPKTHAETFFDLAEILIYAGQNDAEIMKLAKGVLEIAERVNPNNKRLKELSGRINDPLKPSKNPQSQANLFYSLARLLMHEEQCDAGIVKMAEGLLEAAKRIDPRDKRLDELLARINTFKAEQSKRAKL